MLVFSAQTVSTAQAKLSSKFEVKLAIEQQFPRSLFQRNKVFTVSDNKIFILQSNNVNPVTKHKQCDTGMSHYMASSGATVIGRKCI